MSTYKLRDGSTVADPRLDRIFEWDDRNQDFRIRGVAPKPTPWKRVRWPVPDHLRLDQGQEGACAGFSSTHVLEAVPNKLPLGDATKGADFARAVYTQAREIDGIDDSQGEGTSVLAVCKVLQGRNHISGYRWCMSLEEVVSSLQNIGPIVFGTNWYEGMYEPDDRGILNVTGEIVGGHAYMIDGYTPDLRIKHKPFGPALTVQNSWGVDWGREGRAFLLMQDAKRLLEDQGEAAVLSGTKK